MSINLAEPSIYSQRIDESGVDGVVEGFYSTAADQAAWGMTVAWYGQGPDCGVIEYLEDGYEVLQPIPYEIETINDADYLASFDEANIAVGGQSKGDAYQALLAEILDTFDVLVAEEKILGAPAQKQLETLRAYIGKA